MLNLQNIIKTFGDTDTFMLDYIALLDSNDVLIIGHHLSGDSSGVYIAIIGDSSGVYQQQNIAPADIQHFLTRIGERASEFIGIDPLISNRDTLRDHKTDAITTAQLQLAEKNRGASDDDCDRNLAEFQQIVSHILTLDTVSDVQAYECKFAGDTIALA